MHLTWAPGDPIVQLNFPNPLNVSVQIGDVAYFSNPVPVGQAQSWADTTTPHMSNPQSGIIMIGEIIQIIPWNGTVSSIICQMPQILFNQYFDQIIEGVCIQVPSGNITSSGHCSTFQQGGAINHPVLDYTDPDFINIFYSTPLSPHPSDPFHYLFDNPNVSTFDIMFHAAGVLPEHPVYCHVDPLAKSVNGINDYVVGAENYWSVINSVHLYLVNCTGFPISCLFPVVGVPGQSIQSGPGETTNSSSDKFMSPFTANDIIDKMINLYPTAGYTQGVSFTDFINFHNNYQNNLLTQLTGQPSNATFAVTSLPDQAIAGTYSDTYTETCTQGSFIMFSKDNKVNMSDMLGYYASVELRNDSKTEAELFNVGTSFFESSK
jgi:hypothetical protein